MKADVKSKLEKLRDDYSQIIGRPFIHFYCPILFKDEETPLCQAHIINEAFRNSPRAWTVERRDIDSFYGSNFEADFIAIQYKTENWSPGEIITDKTLSNKLSPRILVAGEPVDYFFAQGNIPEDYTRIEIESNGKSVQLGLKMHPQEFITATEQTWQIEINKDVRLPALVSLIKAAHLTLFEMLGYHYALSAGVHFVGRQILGEFFLQNRERTSKREILENAHSFFREFVHMVRPIQSCALGIRGTITDRLLLVCRGNSSTNWAFVVFIRTLQQLHAVMIPVFEQLDAAATFINFLKNDNDLVEANFCRFDQPQGCWEINKESFQLVWPKSGILYP